MGVCCLSEEKKKYPEKSVLELKKKHNLATKIKANFFEDELKFTEIISNKKIASLISI